MHSSNPLDAFCLAMNSGSRFPSTDSDVNNATLCHQQQPPIRSTSLSSSDLTLSRGNRNTEIGYLPSSSLSRLPPPQDHLHLMMLNSSERHLEPTTTSCNIRERGSKSSGGSNVTAPATSAYPSLKSLSPCSSSGSFTGTSPQAVPLLGPTTISRPGAVASPSQQQQYVTVQLPNQEAGHHLVLQQPKPQLLIPGVAPLLAAPLVVAPPPPVSSNANGGGGVSLPPPPTYGATVGPCMPTPNPSNNSHNSSKQQSISSKAINYGEMWRNKHGGKKNKV